MQVAGAVVWVDGRRGVQGTVNSGLRFFFLVSAQVRQTAEQKARQAAAFRLG